MDSERADYYGSASECGFFVGEKNRKHFLGGHYQNSFAPVAKAKMVEKEDVTTVSMIIRMNLLVLILFVPIYIISLITIVLSPAVLLLLYFAFVRPAERLKQTIENLLIQNRV